MFYNLPWRFLFPNSFRNRTLTLATFSSLAKLFSSEHKKLSPISNRSFESTAIGFFRAFTVCKNTNHLNSLKSLLIAYGLIEHELLLEHFLKSCFHLGALDIALSTFYTVQNPSLLLQNLMVKSLCNYGMYEDVLSVYMTCRSSGCPSDNFTFPFVIKACSARGEFGIGKEIHCVVLRTGYEQNVVIQTTLIDFYAKSGNVGTARSLIDKISQPDLISWNALIACYSLHGLDQEALNAFKHIFFMGLKPNLSTLASVIPVCTRLGCLKVGKSLHGFAVKSGYLGSDFLVPALISLYAGEIQISSARKLFDYVLEKNTAVWNAMISACTQKLMPFEAFELFQEMLRTDGQPDSVTFVSIIPSCQIFGGILYGESFHAWVIKQGSESQPSVLTALISMYAKLGDISKAKFLFDWIPHRSLLSWNVMLSGYMRNGFWDASLSAFCEMQLDGFSPDTVSITSVLSACSKLEAILLGKSAHAYSIRKGIDSNLTVSNALLAFYLDCNDLTSSFKLFHRMARDTMSWNTMISGLVHSGDVGKAVDLLHQLQREVMVLDLVTLISILPICSDTENLGQGMSVHAYAIKNGSISDVCLVNALISMYCKCGDLDAGKSLFKVMPERSLVTWNALITGLRHHNLQNDVLFCFRQLQEGDLRPNSVTLLNVVPLCSSQLQVKSIHAFAIRTGVVQETHLLTSLIFVYARFENEYLCLLLFEMGRKREISLWNAIISAHIQMKKAKKAVSFFSDLLQMSLLPDHVTVLSLITACSQLNSLDLAHSVMAYVIRKGFDKDATIINALIDLYARCGDIFTAEGLFQGLLENNVVSWNVMINGYGMHGDGEAALQLFSKILVSGVRPNVMTFSSVLSACSHAGLVEQGLKIFNSMVEHGLSPRMEHYACMLDLLGRTGQLNEAYDIVKKLPCKPSINILESLLGACKIHGNVELAEKFGQMLLEADPENSELYVMLSNVYAAAGRWIDANRVRHNIERRQLRKEAGFSLLPSNEHQNLSPPRRAAGAGPAQPSSHVRVESLRSSLIMAR